MCFSPWFTRWFPSPYWAVLCTEDFTLLSTITPAVLDAQMNLTLSLITLSVPGCTTSSFLSGDVLRYCNKEIAYYTT